MPKRSMKQDDPLEDFARREITLDGVSKCVYVAGSGPAVIVMTEMPGCGRWRDWPTARAAVPPG
jgi:hypothetical protein